jgi:hypothetical protein
MPERMLGRLLLLAQAPRVAPMAETAAIPRIPRRAIDRGTRQA